MIKHTQTIRSECLSENELFECVWPFCGVALKKLIWQGVQKVSRGAVLKVLLNIYDGLFCENYQRPNDAIYFWKRNPVKELGKILYSPLVC